MKTRTSGWGSPCRVCKSFTYCQDIDSKGTCRDCVKKSNEKFIQKKYDFV